MKSRMLISTFMILVGVGLYAQKDRNAIGLRLGYAAQEITYQHILGSADRLELTFGVNNLGHTQLGKLCRGFVLNGLIQRVNELSLLSTGINWYWGLGAAVLDHGSLSHGMYGVGVLGQIGVEYAFHSPWQLSLDYRPGFYWLPGSGNIYRMSWNSPCIALRHNF